MSSSIETLYDIQENQKPELAEMFYATKYYDIDLATRTIETPEYLSVAKDHKAENIYFRIKDANELDGYEKEISLLKTLYR